MIRMLLAVVVIVSAVAFAGEAQAASRALTRTEIRRMPMVARPNRPGHFFGNTVRRLAGR